MERGEPQDFLFKCKSLFSGLWFLTADIQGEWSLPFAKSCCVEFQESRVYPLDSPRPQIPARKVGICVSPYWWPSDSCVSKETCQAPRLSRKRDSRASSCSAHLEMAYPLCKDIMQLLISHWNFKNQRKPLSFINSITSFQGQWRLFICRGWERWLLQF